jgi:hypothetical protein
MAKRKIPAPTANQIQLFECIAKSYIVRFVVFTAMTVFSDVTECTLEAYQHFGGVTVSMDLSRIQE